MRLIKTGGRDSRVFINEIIKRATRDTGEIEEKVRRILSDIKREGDRAIVRYTELYDGISLKPSEIKLSRDKIKKACKSLNKKILKSLEISAERIRRFHEMERLNSWFTVEDGSILGQLRRPLRRVGVYVPGGKAAYPSSVMMNVIPAKVAGVDEIAMCVPTQRGEINPYVLAVADIAGVTEIYRIGGAQAIGAMAYGTRTIPKVDKIICPGNIYVATAKRLVFGIVDIDMIAGPSEILIIADEKADPVFIAADLLSQAEHDEMASSILLTDSKSLAIKTEKEVSKQLKKTKRKTIAEKSLKKYGAIIVTKNMIEAIDIANEIAPEHLEIMVERPLEIIGKIKNAGAIFLGPWTPEAVGDYSAGPNHVLPTGGTARFFSPLGVEDFMKRTNLLSFSRKGLEGIGDTVIRIAEIEGLKAHGESVRIRLKNKKG
ncbi:MAG: histidinol dehydrogenase [Nitrospirae bacterium]|nr:histidinol dehydrogenase [Nitrospirota bacterium]